MNQNTSPAQPPRYGTELGWVLFVSLLAGITLAALSIPSAQKLFGSSVGTPLVGQLFTTLGLFVVPGLWLRTRLERQQLALPALAAPKLSYLHITAFLLLLPTTIPLTEALSTSLHQWIVDNGFWPERMAAEKQQAALIDKMLFSQQPAFRWLAFFVFVPLAATAEEFFFRGTLQRLASAGYGATRGLLVSTLVFALAHQSITQLPFLLCAGFSLAWIYQRTGRLWMVIVAHLSHNMTTYFITTSAGPGSYGQSAFPMLSWSVLVALFAFGAGLTAWASSDLMKRS